MMKGASDGRTSKTAEVLRKLVVEHAASGLTQGEFCMPRGVVVKQLQRWRSKLRDELGLDVHGGAVEIVVAAGPGHVGTRTVTSYESKKREARRC